jgi:F-type H+-transporting ATPase subunit delta
MRSLKIAKSYAKALLKTAESIQRTDAVYRDLVYLNEVIFQSAEFELFLSPYFNTESHREQVLQELFKDRLDKLTLEFLELLNKRRDLMHLSAIFEEFKDAYCKLRGIVQADIRVACLPSAEQAVLFKEKAKKLFGPQTVSTVMEHPSLLGGFVIESPERIYDYSLSGRLDRLKRRMTRA